MGASVGLGLGFGTGQAFGAIKQLLVPMMPQITMQQPGGMMIEDTSAMGDAAAQQRKRTQAASGRADTIKTGPQGLGEIGSENKGSKSLLGY